MDGIRTAIASRILPLALILGAVAAPVAAADPGTAAKAERGKFLSRQWCASCHVVERDGDRGTDAAPPFPKMADDPGYTETRLRGWLAAPHPPMPDPNLSRKEIDEIAAYILSMRSR